MIFHNDVGIRFKDRDNLLRGRDRLSMDNSPLALIYNPMSETPRPKVGASWRKFSQYAARTCLAMPSTLLAYFDHSSPTKSRGILVILRKFGICLQFFSHLLCHNHLSGIPGEVPFNTDFHTEKDTLISHDVDHNLQISFVSSSHGIVVSS